MRKVKASLLQLVFHIASLTPLAWLLWDLAHGQLGANPIEEIQRRTGRYALTLLVLTLACTPVYNVSGIKQALQLRPWLGFYTLAYASLHLLNFIGVDYRFNFAFLWADIGNKRFVMAGLAAFLILLSLAITSTKGWKRRLGENQQRLHRLIYAAGLLAVIHFFWQTKIDFRRPIIYGTVVVLLLLLRIPRIRRLTSLRGKRLKGERDKQSFTDGV